MTTRTTEWRPGRSLPAVVATCAYVVVVAVLVAVSSLTGDSIGPALYLTAAALTLPMGFLIYPALWANSIATAILGLSPGHEAAVARGGVVVVFCLAALANAAVARLLWQVIRRR
ncbi:hypothetical protein [Paractinoplanes atraurantiacus]|uniref:Uncharacterized protein n=1 Tax=Paractinoplanes atraurantiacus TaxID=1036182 RepID=A0A285K946_9ACTN|nr:hypothetical protein [Actinoplanes atraurantiacus]SNY68507.1 hypothetical protein SAMN05421748_13339 [Actinoplanes atraurantiacus]